MKEKEGEIAAGRPVIPHADRVDFVAGTVRLDPRSTKNRGGRVVILTADLRGILLEQWEKARTLTLGRNPEVTPRDVREAIPSVFHRNGERIKDFRGAWATACETVGLTERIPHDFRRTAVRNMVRAGIPERVAMMISGHKTRSIFDRYDIVGEGDLRAAAERLTAAQGATGNVAGIDGALAEILGEKEGA